mmetsp:Transcript_5324/g.9775  ORF Transcript_5324/g.9775 Transcript_5324/m.9775 type:complete len:165 (-) Transcript_5324:176-670(-)
MLCVRRLILGVPLCGANSIGIAGLVGVWDAVHTHTLHKPLPHTNSHPPPRTQSHKVQQRACNMYSNESIPFEKQGDGAASTAAGEPIRWRFKEQKVVEFQMDILSCACLNIERPKRSGRGSAFEVTVRFGGRKRNITEQRKVCYYVVSVCSYSYVLWNSCGICW